ncbi:MAG TPA: DUF1178 family protein [Stellaceae bacterium]|jgi:hypothetical protein|nr:DUF1178 family protein [Stellaceae bacterium]
MIRFSLRCKEGHEFEAWFRSGEGYEAQQQAGEVACPECGDTHVEKALMAPSIGRTRDAGPPLSPAQMRQMLVKMRQQVEKNCDYVGEQFAEEARKIHYGEADPRGIYGEASDAESKALAEEGIEFGRIPWAPPPDA